MREQTIRASEVSMTFKEIRFFLKPCGMGLREFMKRMKAAGLPTTPETRVTLEQALRFCQPDQVSWIVERLQGLDMLLPAPGAKPLSAYELQYITDNPSVRRKMAVIEEDYNRQLEALQHERTQRIWQLLAAERLRMVGRTKVRKTPPSRALGRE